MLNSAYYLISLLRRLSFTGFVDPSNDAEYFFLNAKISEIVALVVQTQDTSNFAPLVEDILTKGYCITVADIHAAGFLTDKLNEVSNQICQIAKMQFDRLEQNTDIKCVEFDAKLSQCFSVVMAVAISYGVQVSDHVIRYRSRLEAPLEFSTKFESWLKVIEINGVNETTIGEIRLMLTELRTLCRTVEEDIENGLNAPESYLDFFRQYKGAIAYCLLELGSKKFIDKIRGITQQTAVKRAHKATSDNKIIASVIESMDTYYFQTPQ